MDFKKYQDKINGLSKKYEEQRKNPKSMLKYGQLGSSKGDNSRPPPIDVRPLSKVQDPKQWAAPPKKGDPTGPYQPQFAQPVQPAQYPAQYPAQPGMPPQPGYAYPPQGQYPGAPGVPGYGAPYAGAPVQQGYAQPPGQPSPQTYPQPNVAWPQQVPPGQSQGQSPPQQQSYSAAPQVPHSGPPAPARGQPEPEPEAPPKRPIVDPKSFAPPPSRTAPTREQKPHISRRPDRPVPGVPGGQSPPGPSTGPSTGSPSGPPLVPNRPAAPPRPIPQRPVPTPERPPAYDEGTPAPAATCKAPKPKPAKPKPSLDRKSSQVSGTGPTMPDIDALQSRMVAMGLRRDAPDSPDSAPACIQVNAPMGTSTAPAPAPAPSPRPPAPLPPRTEAAPSKPTKPKPSKPKPASKPVVSQGTQGNTGEQANADLELDSLWYTAPINQLKLPAAFAGRSYSCNGSANSQKENLSFSVRQPNLSVLRINLEWPKSNPHAVKVDRKEGYPPRPMVNEELAQQSDRFGNAVAQWSEQQQGRRVGDGECWTLAKEALAASGAMPSQAYVHGAQVLRQEGNNVIYSYDMMRRGDIVQFECAVFTRSSTGPHHTAVITGIEHSILHVLEQNVQGSAVQPGRYDLQTMTGGTLVVYRPVSQDWIEPL